MFSSLEKHWPIISAALLAILLASLLLWPEMQGPISLAIIIISVGMLLTFTVRRRAEEYHKGQIDKPLMTRLILLDCAGILLILISAMYIGSLVSRVVGEKVYITMLPSHPRWAEITAIGLNLLAALAAGVGVGWLIRILWVRVEKVLAGARAQVEEA